MEKPKKFWCYSCEKECQIIKEMVDGEEVYECSTCKKAFVEEMEEKEEKNNLSQNSAPQNNTIQNNTSQNNISQNTTSQNNQNRINNINTVNRINNISIINIPPINNLNLSQNSNNTQNNTSNNNINQDEYGLNNTLLFLPSTVHCERFNSNNFIPSLVNSVGDFFSSLSGPGINSIFSSLNNSNNNILSFLNQHNNDFQFNNLVNIIMSFESSMHGNPPASQRAIENLPKVEVNKDNINNFKDVTCNICLEGFVLGDILRILECKHEFHEKCILTWLKSRNTCPVCRHELESNDPNYERRKHNHRENLRNLHRNNTNNNNNNNNNNGGGGSGLYV